MKNNPEYTPNYSVRTALMATLLATCLSAEAQAGDGAIPFCSDMENRPNPDQVWLNDGETGTIICMVDGDTYYVKLDDSGEIANIRLWGVDCPESSDNDKCERQGCDPKKGKKIAKKIKKMLGKGRVVLKGPFKKNGNRKLAYLIHNGRDLGEKILCDCPPQKHYKYTKKPQYEKKARQCGKR